MTWAEESRSQTARRIWGVMATGELLLSLYSPSTALRSWETYPPGKAMIPPEQDVVPVISADPLEPLAWQRKNQRDAVRADGSPLNLPPETAPSTEFSRYLTAGPMPGSWVVSWTSQQSQVQRTGIVTNGVLTSAFKSSAGVSALVVVAWLDHERALGWLNYSEPALIDFTTGVVHVISGAGHAAEKDSIYGGRNKIVGFELR
jgi:hypothetical protein